MIYKLHDNRIFFTPVFNNTTVDPIELEIINADAGTFKEKNKTTKRYYHITKENTLRYILEDGKVKYEGFATTEN